MNVGAGSLRGTSASFEVDYARDHPMNSFLQLLLFLSRDVALNYRHSSFPHYSQFSQQGPRSESRLDKRRILKHKVHLAKYLLQMACISAQHLGKLTQGDRREQGKLYVGSFYALNGFFRTSY